MAHLQAELQPFGLGSYTPPAQNFWLFPDFCVAWHMWCGLAIPTLPIDFVMWRCAGELVGIRILVAFEDVYRAYREVIAAGIQVLRPQLEVTSTNPKELEREIARLDPQVVISSLDKPASAPDGVVWSKVPIDFAPQSEVTLEALLTLIDEHPESTSPGGSGTTDTAASGNSPPSKAV